MKEISLFDLPPSEEEIYQAAISESLDAKVRKAVGLLRMLCTGKRTIVCFSGGKDSVVIKHLAIMAGIDFDPVYSMTTVDPPELIYYIRDHHKDVVWRNPEMHMLRYMVETGKGLPTRICRWCCEKYKENTGNEYHFKIIGVRAEESVRRKGMWKQVNASRKNKGVMILAPIVYWTDRDVWNFIHGENLAYCRLYDEGFTRLGVLVVRLQDQRNKKLNLNAGHDIKIFGGFILKNFGINGTTYLLNSEILVGLKISVLPSVISTGGCPEKQGTRKTMS